jgi:hypothetical protein
LAVVISAVIKVLLGVLFDPGDLLVGVGLGVQDLLVLGERLLHALAGGIHGGEVGQGAGLVQGRRLGLLQGLVALRLGVIELRLDVGRVLVLLQRRDLLVQLGLLGEDLLGVVDHLLHLGAGGLHLAQHGQGAREVLVGGLGLLHRVRGLGLGLPQPCLDQRLLRMLLQLGDLLVQLGLLRLDLLALGVLGPDFGDQRLELVEHLGRLGVILLGEPALERGHELIQLGGVGALGGQRFLERTGQDAQPLGHVFLGHGDGRGGGLPVRRGFLL